MRRFRQSAEEKMKQQSKSPPKHPNIKPKFPIQNQPMQNLLDDECVDDLGRPKSRRQSTIYGTDGRLVLKKN